MPSNLPAAGPERGTQRDLPLTPGSAGQLQVGDIGTGQQENKDGCAHQHQHKLSRTEGEILDRIYDPDSVAGIALGILFSQARDNRLQVRPSLRHGNAILQPSEHGQIVILAIFFPRAVQVEWSPNL